MYKEYRGHKYRVDIHAYLVLRAATPGRFGRSQYKIKIAIDTSGIVDSV